MSLVFLQQAVQGDTGTKCADVVINPDVGDIPLSIDLSTTQTGGHIFYVVGSSSATPQHTGDSAISPTVRIGANHGSVFIGSGISKYIAAVTYQDGFTDSNIARGGPYVGGPPG